MILTHIKTFRYLFISLLLLSASRGHAQGTKDSLSEYSWLHRDMNFIQFYDRKVLKDFHKKWVDKKDKVITITHFGDSHVQPDIYSGEIRKRLQGIKGGAGYGMIFPFSTANTYATVDYKSTHKGHWSYSKSIEMRPVLPLGATGATSRTMDSNASFTISFKNTPEPDYRRLKLFCKLADNSFDLMLSCAGFDTLIKVSAPEDTKHPLPYIDIKLPRIDNQITIKVKKTDRNQTYFEMYGMSLESVVPNGVLLHCLGIGGSQYPSLLHETLLDEELQVIKPDLAILDFGTNDYVYNNTVPEELEGEIVQIIANMRKSSPNCMVLLTTTMDMERKGKISTAGMAFSDLIRKVAKEQKCPFYDWYWISGGPKAMRLWYQNKLAQLDMVHLQIKGYKIKGQMLADALLNTLDMYGSDKKLDSLIFPMDSFNKVRAEAMANPEGIFPAKAGKTKSSKKGEPKLSGGFIGHKVEHGESLSTIAHKYHVTVAQIQSANKLKGTSIRAGQTIKVPSKTGGSTVSSIKSKGKAKGKGKSKKKAKPKSNNGTVRAGKEKKKKG